jgi:1,4-alpha-glucan branching enzyme
MVIYELHIPTFNPNSQNGTTNEEVSIQQSQDKRRVGAGAIGTFAQAISKLDYLVLLGVNMVEILPIAEFPGNQRGWGYNPGLYFVVMNTFGGYEGLRQFVKAAHSHGIGVIVDVVLNHMV